MSKNDEPVYTADEVEMMLRLKELEKECEFLKKNHDYTRQIAQMAHDRQDNEGADLRKRVKRLEDELLKRHTIFEFLSRYWRVILSIGGIGAIIVSFWDEIVKKFFS